MSDLGALEYIDSAGLQVFMSAAREIRGKGSVALAAPTEQVKHLLDIAPVWPPSRRRTTLPRRPSRRWLADQFTRDTFRILIGGIRRCASTFVERSGDEGAAWIFRTTSIPEITRPNAAKPWPSGLRLPPKSSDG